MIRIHHRSLSNPVRDGLRAVYAAIRSCGGPRAVAGIGFNVIGQAAGAEPCGWIEFSGPDYSGRVYFYGAEHDALRLYERTHRFA